jgi:hypothetical protein
LLGKPGCFPEGSNPFSQMTTFLTILVFISLAILAVAWSLYQKTRALMQEVRRMKDEIGQMKNMGDLLSVTEDTLEEAGKAINTAKRVMDGRIRRMEELLNEIDARIPEMENQVGGIRGEIRTGQIRQQFEQGGRGSQIGSNNDPDADERELIARRNRQIILMLEEGKTIEEIARVTGASVREIQLIKKFVK